MIVQFEGAKRNLTLIFGKHRGDPDDDGESDGFGFRPQRATA